MRGLSLFAIILISASGCGIHAGVNSSTDTGTVDAGNSSSITTYDLKVNQTCMGTGCTAEDNEKCETSHTFTSHAQYCDGLSDGKLNEGCARQKRKALFGVSCDGTFEDHNLGGISSSGPDACKSDQRLKAEDLTRTQLCSLIHDDETANPCTLQFEYYRDYKSKFECP